jgi:hypothetical protein
VSRAAFENNLREKLTDIRFAGDTHPLIIDEAGYNLERAAALVMDKLSCLIPEET